MIKNEDFTLVVMAIVSFLPSSTTSDKSKNTPIPAETTKLGSGHNSLE
jgi:hypothetical protein